jgi:N-formylglutamate deformylase
VRSDRQFLEAFEACTLPAEEFHHPDHVRLAYFYLRDFPPAEALMRFVEGLRRFAASLGKPGLYHETITWAYLLLIRERMARGGAADFAEFRRLNPDLFTWQPSLLDSYYRPETLWSELAREVFVMPDRGVVGRQLSVVSSSTDN